MFSMENGVFAVTVVADCCLLPLPATLLWLTVPALLAALTSDCGGEAVMRSLTCMDIFRNFLVPKIFVNIF